MKKKKLVVLLLVIVFFGAIFIKQQLIINKLNREYDEYKDQLARVQQQTDQLNEQLKIMQREDYIEKLAREKLRLVKPGEMLFIDKNKKR